MNRRMLPVLLAAAAVLVVVENYLYFQASSDAGRTARRGGQEELAQDSDLGGASERESDVSVGPPPALSTDQLRTLIAGLTHERSPFLAGGSTTASPESMRGGLPQLAGTLIGDGRRVAWMNGQPRREGEQVGPFVVTEIDQGRVTLLRDGRPYTLELETDAAPLEEAR
jgi:hypothetical protein